MISKYQYDRETVELTPVMKEWAIQIPSFRGWESGMEGGRGEVEGREREIVRNNQNILVSPTQILRHFFHFPPSHFLLSPSSFSTPPFLSFTPSMSSARFTSDNRKEIRPLPLISTLSSLLLPIHRQYYFRVHTIVQNISTIQNIWISEAYRTRRSPGGSQTAGSLTPVGSRYCMGLDMAHS